MAEPEGSAREFLPHEDDRGGRDDDDGHGDVGDDDCDDEIMIFCVAEPEGSAREFSPHVRRILIIVNLGTTPHFLTCKSEFVTK